MKNIILFILTVTIYNQLFAQSEMSVFSATGRAGVATTFVTDYQAIGINPANLGMGPEFEYTHFNLGFSEVGFSIFSSALSKQQLRESLTNFDEKFNYEKKAIAAKQFINAPLAINIDIMPIAIAVYYPIVGGFAVNVRERIQWYSRFNEGLSDLLFLGYNSPYFDLLQLQDSTLIPNDLSLPDSIRNLVIKGFTTDPQKFSKILDGSKLQMTWFREYNFSYGKQLLGNVDMIQGRYSTGSSAKTSDISLYAGIGLKFIQGFGLIDIGAKDGKLTAFTAISPFFGIDYGKTASQNPSIDTMNKGFLPESVGRGFGVDLSVNFRYKEKLTAGFAITNIGSIKWYGNVFTAKDSTLNEMLSSGFDNYNIFFEAEKISGDKGIFKWEGLKDTITKLPTLIRTGISYKIEEFAEIGIDIIVSANDAVGSYDKAIFSFGGDLKPNRWLRLSTGFTFGGNYDFNIPIGIRIIAGEDGNWEVGIASRDVITFFTNKGPNISASFGFMRFRF